MEIVRGSPRRPWATLDFRSRIRSLERNPFTLYWGTPWPLAERISALAYNKGRGASLGARERCLFLIIS